MKKYDFHLYRGDDKNFLIKTKLINNSSLDILNSRFILQVRKTEETTNRVNNIYYQSNGLPKRHSRQPQESNNFGELKQKSDLPLLFTLSTENNKIKVLNNGNIIIMFEHEDTDLATWKQAEYDLQIITPRGKYRTIMKGKVLLDKDLTE